MNECVTTSQSSHFGKKHYTVWLQNVSVWLINIVIKYVMEMLYVNWLNQRIPESQVAFLIL